MAKIEHRKDGEVNIAVVSSDEKVAVGLQSALDLAMAVKYETDASRIVMSKKAICDSFLFSAPESQDRYYKSSFIIR